MFFPFKSILWSDGITRLSNTIEAFQKAKLEQKEEALNEVIKALHILRNYRPDVLNFIHTKREDSLHILNNFISNLTKDFTLYSHLANQIGQIQILHALLHENIGKRDSILPLLEEAEKTFKALCKEETDNFPIYPVILSTIGRTYVRYFEFDMALKYFERSEPLFDKIKCLDNYYIEESFQFSFFYSYILHSRGEFQKLKAILPKMKEKIKTLEKKEDLSFEYKADIYNQFAVFHDSIEDFDNALWGYQKELIYLEQAIDEFLPQENQIDFMFQLQRPSFSFSPSELEFNRSRILEKEREWKEHIKDLEIQRIRSDPRCKYILTVIDIAKIYFFYQDDDHAKSFLEENLLKYQIIFEKYPAIQITYADALSLLGNIYLALDNAEEALDLALKGMKIYKEYKLFDELHYHIHITNSYIQLARFYLFLERFKEAENILEEFLEELEAFEIEKKRELFMQVLESYLIRVIIKSNLKQFDECFNIILDSLEMYKQNKREKDERAYQATQIIKSICKIAEELCIEVENEDICLEIKERMKELNL